LTKHTKRRKEKSVKDEFVSAMPAVANMTGTILELPVSSERVFTQ